MTSDNARSFLCSQSKADLKEFRWDRLHAELSNNAPTLLSILLAATKTRVPRPNAHIVVGIYLCGHTAQALQSKNELIAEDHFPCTLCWPRIKTGNIICASCM